MIEARHGGQHQGRRPTEMTLRHGIAPLRKLSSSVPRTAIRDARHDAPSESPAAVGADAAFDEVLAFVLPRLRRDLLFASGSSVSPLDSAFSSFSRILTLARKSWEGPSFGLSLNPFPRTTERLLDLVVLGGLVVFCLGRIDELAQVENGLMVGVAPITDLGVDSFLRLGVGRLALELVEKERILIDLHLELVL